MLRELTLHVFDEHGDVHRELLVRRPYAIVGSGDDTDVELPNLPVSMSRRIYLQAVDEGVVSIELASDHEPAAGTPARTRLLDVEERLQIGPYSVTAAVRTDQSPVHRSPEASRLMNQPRDTTRLRFINAHSRTVRKSTRRLRETLTLIGSSNRCHIKLSHPDIPEIHSSVVRSGDELWALGISRECPLQVNGRVVRHCRLQSGDILSIGPFLMQFQEQRPAPAEESTRPEQQDSTADHTVESEDNGSPGQLPAVAMTGLQKTRHAAEAEPETASAEWDVMACPPDGDVAALVKQLTSVHQMLSEQSQLQTSLLIHLLGAAQKNQTSSQDLLRDQIAAIKEIANELHTWRTEMQNHQSDPRGGQPQQFEFSGLPHPLPRIPQVSDTATAGESLREPKTAKDIEAHASLSDRIGLLERERNSLIQKIMHLLQRSSDK